MGNRGLRGSDLSRTTPQMRTDELDFSYPDNLVATERASMSRVMLVRQGQPSELETGLNGLIDLIEPEDCLIINDTRVLKRRVFTESGLEILFLAPNDESLRTWQVLCPSSRWKDGTEQILPQGVRLQIVGRGRPQVVEANQPLSEDYFESFGEMPLPPYIQKARGERHNRGTDQSQYQTAWAERDGSLAAPTASLHLSTDHLDALKRKGVRVASVTLHVGLGTFLPVTVEDLTQHMMHQERAEIPWDTWRLIQETKASEGRVWALGTTVARTLESAAHGLLNEGQPGASESAYAGATDLFIRPGFEFRMVDVLMTNFHQPRSTLLALVAAFSGLETVRKAYDWAIEKQFRLFSYGDLSVWMK